MKFRTVRMLALILLVSSSIGCLEIIGVDQPEQVAMYGAFEVTVSFSSTISANGTKFGAVKVPNQFYVNQVTYCGGVTLAYSSSIESMLEAGYPSGDDYFWWAGVSYAETATGPCDAVIEIFSGDTVADYELDYRVGYYRTGLVVTDSELEVPVHVFRDNDYDGMDDEWEDLHWCVYSTYDDSMSDPDWDDLTNIEEFMVSYSMDPCFYDTDGDGLDDGDEVDMYFTNPVDPDTDGDGLEDGYEIFSSYTYPDDPDSDDDSMTDGWEDAYYCVNPMYSDSTMNPDGDGALNGAEYRHGTNPCVYDDADGDGMPDDYENAHACLNVNIPDAAWDMDGDGLTNGEEYGLSTNPCSPDTDGDGLQDLFEVYIYQTNPNDIDTDGEGLTDLVEIYISDSEPTMPDSDGDGLSDAFEVGVIVGTGPNRVLDTVPAGDDESEYEAIWVGTDLSPGTTAAADDLQIIPRFPSYPRLFITDPMDPDSDGDGIDDRIEVEWGANPNDDSITPALGMVGGSDKVVTVASSLYDNDPVRLEWTGSEYGMAFGNYFYRLDEEGNDIQSVWISGERLDVAWTGSEFGIIYSDDYYDELSFIRVTAGGTELWPETRLSYNGYTEYDPKIEWNGSEFGVIWLEGNFEGLFFTRVSYDGSQIGGAVKVVDDYSDVFDIEWADSVYGVAWEDFRHDSDGSCGGQSPDCNNEIYFRKITAQGDTIGSETRLSFSVENSMGPDLVWNGTDFGVAFEEELGDSEIMFARVQMDGGTLGQPERITYVNDYSTRPRLEWNGSVYGLSWQDTRSSVNEIYFNYLSPAGDAIGMDARISFTGAMSNPSGIAWNGNKFAMAWKDSYTEFYYAVVPEESDGDGILDSIEEGTCTDVLNFDSDFDGISDGIEDANHDGVKQSSEIDPCDPDTDGDGLCDGNMTIAGVCDAGEDQNGNGIVDSGETDPNDPDTDGDGIDDWEEIFPGDDGYVTNPLSTDTDGDSYSDDLEIDKGSSPSDPDSHPRFGKILDNIEVVDTVMGNHALAYGTTSFALVWNNGLALYMDILDPAGVTLDPNNLITSDSCAGPDIVWTGSKYGVAYQNYDSTNSIVLMKALNPDGSGGGGKGFTVSSVGSYYNLPTLDWSGSEYGVTWPDDRYANNEIFFQRMTASLTKTGAAVRISSNSEDSKRPDIAWSGSEYGVAWDDYRDGNAEIYFRIVGPAGSLVTPETRLTFNSSYSYRPKVAWNGSEYGITWYDYRDVGTCSETYFTRVSAGGTQLQANQRISYNGGCSWGQDIVWSGSEYGLAWYQPMDGYDEIFFTRISEDGDTIIPEFRVTYSNEVHQINPKISYGAGVYGVAWMINTGKGYSTIFYTAIGPDDDGDGIYNILEDGFSTDVNDWDTDDDGLSDQEEICYDDDCDSFNPAIEPNPTLYDTDSDGISDYDEVTLYFTSPTRVDTDGDGMPDLWEIQNNLSPIAPNGGGDADIDGLSNLNEYLAGTDPNDPDTDGDGMDDDWEVLYGGTAGCMMATTVDDGLDYDGDGLINQFEHDQDRDPCTYETLPSSSCYSGVSMTNADTIGLDFTCTDPYSITFLKVSYEGGPFLNAGLYAENQTSGRFVYTFNQGDGRYRFYTIASITVFLTEEPPVLPPYDVMVTVDKTTPISYVSAAPSFAPDETFPIEFLCDDLEAQSRLYYRKDGGGWTNSGLGLLAGDSGTFSFTPAGEGTYDFYTIAGDPAGNIEDPPTFPDKDATTVVDDSPPAVPVVTDDGTYTGYTDRFHATWTCGGDSVSGVVQYDYAIGSSAGATDVVGWTDNATLTEVTRFGLELEDGSSYFIGVRAVNGAGLVSVGWSDGILVDSRGPEIAWSSPAHREIVNDDMPPVDLPVSINFIDPGGAGIDWASLEMVLDFSTVQSFSQDGDTVSFDALALDLGNHVVNVQVADLAGNGLNRNVIFVVEDPRRVIINPVYVEWGPGDGDVTFVADGGTGAYRWAATGGALDSFTGTEVVFTPGPEAGAYVVAVSDAKLVSAQATIIISGEVEVAPAVVRLSAGSAATFTASGGSGDFSWTVNGGSCVLSGERDETCSYTAFESSGQYSVKAQAGSGESFTSRVIVTDPVGRAIVVVGGGLVDSNRQVEALNSLGHLAYETLLARGFEPDQIMYLNPDATQAYDGDGDGYADDVDGAPTPAALQAAILDWATADLGVDNPGVGPGVPLIIYMVDHGGDDSFLINFTAAGAGQEVTPTQLDSWIDAVQGGDTSNPNGVDVVVIYDACRSGSFLDEVGGGGSDRIVITSSASSESAYFGVSGTISFSQFFWQRVRTGATLKSAFNDAAAALATWATQTPWLDDNGSGTYAATGDGKDGDVADLFVVGADFVTGAVLPELTPRGDALLEGDSLDIYSGILYASSSEISAMFAILTPPGFSPPQSEGNFDTPWLEDEEGNPLPRVYLEYSSATDDWRRRLDSAELAELFTVNGRYTATLYAIDLEGRVTAAAEFSITVFGPDPYEDDDWWSSGSSVEVNSSSAQAHNFHDSGDRDWVKFSVAFGDTGYYSVYTENLADRCDTVIELYGYSVAGSTVVPIAFDDDSGQDGGGSSRIFMYLSEGLYYAEVYQYGDTIGGQDTEYDLRVDHDEGDYGSVEGYVTDSVTGFGVQGANVIVILGGPPRVATTGAGGYYKLSSLLAGSGYPMQVQAANFTTWSGTVNVGVNQTTRKDVVLAAKTGTSGVLMGHVYGHGGAPLVGVGLEVSGKSVVSEAGGLYSIRLAPGAAYVYSSWPGYEPYLEEGLMVAAGDTTVHEVSLEPVDTDGDGLPDWIETSGCTDETEADSDGDGLCDGDTAVYDGATLVCSAGEDLDLDGEVGASETDPCDDDSDGDLLGDGDEALTYGTDPLETDTDSDGLGDRLEAVVVSCLDPTDDDTDDDGLLDGTSSGEDKDGDGVVDATETSPCLFDTDTDTLGDGAEVTVYGTDPLEVDTDSDGLSDGLEVPWCTSPTDEDSDGDGLLDGTPSGEDKDGDGVVDATETNPCAFDSDSDGIGDGLELGTYGTNPLRQDTDSDGIGDYVEAVSSACLDATEADTDGDGLLDGTIFGEDKDGDGVVDPGETNPCLEDSDEDGLGDDEEPGLGLDPLEWDTDGDALPDGYEVANSSGHALNLDPLDPGDGCASDFDGDGNANCHEYYNGTDIWSENVTGGSACFSWADSGSTVSADGLVSPLDLGALNARASLKDASYTGVLPPNGDSQELDMDEIISALDLAVLRQMVANLSTSGNPSRPVALEVYGDTAVTAEVGSTVRIELGALNQGGKHTSSLGIIFTIDPSSTASATLLGGDGSASSGRYDVTGPIATGGRSAIVLLPTAPGTLLLNAHLPPCGVDGKGRYCEELIKQPLVTVTVE